MMLSLDTAYRSFGGEVEASSTPTICRLPDSRRHQLSAIAPDYPIFCAGVKNIADIKCALIAARQTYCRMSPSLVLPTKWAKKVAITGRGFRMLIAPAFSRGEAARLLKTFEEGRRLCFVVEPSHQGDAL
jgi:hypothetical protein